MQQMHFIDSYAVNKNVSSLFLNTSIDMSSEHSSAGTVYKFSSFAITLTSTKISLVMNCDEVIQPMHQPHNCAKQINKKLIHSTEIQMKCCYKKKIIHYSYKSPLR